MTRGAVWGSGSLSQPDLEPGGRWPVALHLGVLDVSGGREVGLFFSCSNFQSSELKCLASEAGFGVR